MQLALPGLESPSPALILSALVKCIRLRRTDDAVKWLVALWAIPSLRARLARRVLISSAEDTLSPSVVCRVAEWFRSPSRHSLHAAAEQVIRICKSTPWWSCEEGHRYIAAWVRAAALAETLPYRSFATEWESIRSAIRDRDLTSGLAAFTRLSSLPKFSNYLIFDLVGVEAERVAERDLLELFDCWRAVGSVLGRDTNVVGMLLYALLGGDVHGELEGLSAPCDSVQLIARARGELDGPLSVPAWANDGIHVRVTGPPDSRFAGILSNFAAMCRAYDFYGRLDPIDPWLPEFYEKR